MNNLIEEAERRAAKYETLHDEWAATGKTFVVDVPSTQEILRALLAHNLALTERIEALERGKDEMTVRTAVAITAQDSFAGAALIAYNVLQEQHDTLAALAKLGVYENDGFRDAVRYEMAREMLKDYLPPTPPGAQP